MKVAVIDLGTNTFNLLIAEVSGKSFTELYSGRIPVRLGECGFQKCVIEEAPFRRGIEALQEYRKITQQYGAEQVLALATSAIREALNKDQFIAAALEEAGMNVQVISGDEEAEYIYYGVRAAAKLGEQPVLIMDIGGGSTEFIIANDKTIFWKHSFLLGVSRLQEHFKPSDPITGKEADEIEVYFEKELKPLFFALKKFPVHELVGSSGSFDSLADMILHRFYTPEAREGKTEYFFNMSDYYAIHQLLLGSSLEERLRMKGLIEMRADMIVIASVFVNFLLTRLKLDKLRLSAYSLMEGVVARGL